MAKARKRVNGERKIQLDKKEKKKECMEGEKYSQTRKERKRENRVKKIQLDKETKKKREWREKIQLDNETKKNREW